MLPNLTKVWITIDFKLNQDRIAKTLCVKKDEVHNTCKGACHLKKQLDKVDEHEHEQNQTSDSLKKLKDIQLFSEANSVYSFEISQLASTILYQHYFSPDTDKHIFSVFHPPQV